MKIELNFGSQIAPTELNESAMRVYYSYRYLPEKEVVCRSAVLDAFSLFVNILDNAKSLGFLEESVIRANLALPQWYTGSIPNIDNNSPLEEVLKKAEEWLSNAKSIYAADAVAVNHLLYHALESARFSSKQLALFDEIYRYCEHHRSN